MQKILFPILSSILTFASFLPVAFAQTLNNNANNSIHKSVKGKLTERQWRELNKRYYQSRYLNQFTSKNSFQLYGKSRKYWRMGEDVVRLTSKIFINIGIANIVLISKKNKGNFCLSSTRWFN